MENLLLKCRIDCWFIVRFLSSHKAKNYIENESNKIITNELKKTLYYTLRSEINNFFLNYGLIYSKKVFIINKKFKLYK